MRVGEAFDLIVIGDQLSGLFLAAGAAQRGLKVLVLEQTGAPTVLYEVPSGRFLSDQMAEPMIGLDEGGPPDLFLKSLGLYQDLDQLLPRHEPPLQLLSPGFRVDFAYSPEALAQELRREVQLPEQARERLCSLLSGAIVSKRPFPRVVADLGLDVAYEALGPLQATLYGSFAPDQLSYSDYRELMRLCARGVRYPLGGRGALKERLLARIQLLGGSLRRNSRVEEIVFERGRLAGVLLSSYEGFVRAPRVAGALAVGTFARLVPEKLRPARLEAAVRAVAPRAWKLGFTLLVPEAVIPEGLGTHVACLDPDRGLEEEGLIQLQVFPKGTYGGIPAHHRAILGRVLVPFEESSLAPRAISVLLRRVLTRLECFLPFLREQPIAFFPDPDNLEADEVFQKHYRFKDLSYIPGSLLVYERAFAEGQAPSAFLDWSGLGLPGLALCSRDIRPFQGTLGEVVSAMDLLSLWLGKPGGAP